MTRRGKRLCYAVPGVLVAAVALTGLLYARNLQADAERLAEAGRGHQQLLQRLKQAIQRQDESEISRCYHPDYSSARGGSWEQVLSVDRDGAKTYQWRVTDVRGRRSGADDEFAELFQAIDTFESMQAKLVRVEEIDGTDRAVVKAFLRWRGTRSGNGGTPLADDFESQVLLRLRTEKDANSGEWSIRDQELIHGKTTVGNGGGFRDATVAAGINFVASYNPRWSTPEWDPKIFGLVKHTTGGVTAADYDGDGWEDLLFVNGDGVLLYRNLGNATFTDATAAAGLPVRLIGGTVGIFADLDNDGDRDLFLGSSTDDNLLFRNEGDGTFTDVTEAANLGRGFVPVASAADYDGDGLLDLYLGRYLDPRVRLPTTLFYTRNSEGNSLLRNLGSLKFEDVTETAGVRDGGLTLGLAWADYDSDGDQDLYVANDFGRNGLYRNNGDGTFDDVAQESGALDFGFGMSASFGDADNDGDLDLYVSNVHSAQRWYGQAAILYQYLITSLMQGTIVDDLSTYLEIFELAGDGWSSIGDQMTKGNSLLINDGAGRFVDVSESSHANPYGWYWSSALLDFDNDGQQDIFAVNDWISAKSKDDL